jgi:hypothetical protein
LHLVDPKRYTYDAAGVKPLLVEDDETLPAGQRDRRSHHLGVVARRPAVGKCEHLPHPMYG